MTFSISGPVSGRRGFPGALAGAVLALSAVGLLPQTALAQSPTQPETCANGVVARVEVINNSLWAPRDIEGRRSAWLYKVVNAAHIRTRESFIREQVTVAEGQCYDEVVVAESGRLLRDLSFMAGAQESAEQLPDGDWVVRLETWDEWTTMISINAAVEDKFEFEAISVEEKNLLGRGGQAIFEYRNYRERRDIGLTLLTRRFLGTLAEASVQGGLSRNGYLFDQVVNYPFRGETGTFSFNTEVFLKDSDFSFYTGDSDGISHILLPVTEHRFSGQLRWRFGDLERRTTLDVELEADRPTGAGNPRVAVENSYDELVDAPDSLVAGLGRQVNLQSHVQLGVMAGIRRLHFEIRDGLDLLFGSQDVATGVEVKLGLGRTLATWDTRELSTFANAEFFLSGATPWMVAQLMGEGEGHLLDSALPGESRTRDLWTLSRFYLYLTPPGAFRHHTILAQVGYEGAWRWDHRRQMSLGGSQWVRSFLDFESPVSQRFVVRLEERYRIPGLPPALDLGIGGFVDYGRGWSGDLPFSQDIPWTTAVGVGIRLALPAKSGNVFRMELAWPTDGSGDPTFRVVKDRGRTGR